MRILASLLTGALLCSHLFAQHVIVRQHAGTSHFYYHAAADAFDTLLVALNDADHGDTLHLPWATYDITSTVFLRKGIVIIGTGIDPDSTSATGRTTFTGPGAGQVRIMNTANNLELHGLTFTGGDIWFGENTGNQDSSIATTAVDGVRIVRCVLPAQFWLSYTSNNQHSLATNTSFEGCVIRQLHVKWASSTIIRNCVVAGSTTGSIMDADAGCSIEHCVVLGYSVATDGGGNGTYYRDNIFLCTAPGNFAPSEASVFEHNLYVLQAGGTFDDSGLLVSEGNQHVDLIGAVFQAPPSYTLFDWNQDYHLVPGGLGTTMPTTDGTQVGIHGGDPLNAWKVGALPFNPHWEHLSAPGASNSGVLQGVQVRGTAQTH